MTALLRFLPLAYLAGQAIAGPSPSTGQNSLRLPFALGDHRGPVERRATNPSTGTNNKVWVSLGLGSPPQYLNFLLDSGADDFSVASVLAPNNGNSLGDQPKYNPRNSACAQKKDGYTYHVEFGSGASYDGDVYTECVTVNGQRFNNVPLMVITNGSSSTNDRSGNLGLDANKYAPTTPGGVPSFLQAIKSQVASQRALAAYHYQFSLNEGGVDFGAINSSLYVDPLHWHPNTPNQTLWKLNFDGIYASGRYVPWNFTAALDWGTGDGTLPRYILDVYFQQVSGATFDSSLNTYTFPCDAKLPDFSIIINSNNVSPPAENWVRGSIGNSGSRCSCRLVADPDAHTGFLGQAFLTGIYTVFDQDTNMVGLANRPKTTPITDVTPQTLNVVICSGASYSGSCSGLSTQNSLCQPLTGKPQYHALRSFITTQGGCVVYSDTGCATPLLTTAVGQNSDLGASVAAKVGSYACFGPSDFPPRGSSSFSINDKTGFVGNHLEIPWKSYECHNIPTNWLNRVKAFKSINTGYCFIYQQPNCQGIIGDGEPYVTPPQDSTPAAINMKSFLCY